MINFTAELNQRLDEIRRQGLYRELRRVDSPQSPRIVVNGRTLLNFSSNDYLGLADHPVLKDAAIKAVATRHGATAGQVALAWGLRNPGVVTIPKTATLARVEENLGALDLRLTAADFAEIDAAFPPPRRAQPLEMI